MSAVQGGDEQLTCGRVALRVRGDVQVHHVRQWCDAGLIQHTRVGRLRIVPASELDRVRTIARARGLLRDEPEAATAMSMAMA